jgi:mono/diheme cytochrome c family protein
VRAPGPAATPPGDATGPRDRAGRPGRWRVALVALLLLGLGAGLAVAFLESPGPPSPGPEPGRTLYAAHCATCHGADGRGDTWRARLLWLAPGDLRAAATAGLPEEYLHDVIRHGGSSFGKPGMPSFGFALRDEEIRALVAYLQALGGG